ncbi:hypothetical protein E2C01_006162 [Portunus trituberculatus]|uniref:Uncharacterized protein n=1 Tax=Portunus trituberculatus TaxID=210409 RepID=A0A5B7CUE4_PORTR|nr:hypothetical protein [Portunus trituberculatus]
MVKKHSSTEGVIEHLLCRAAPRRAAGRMIVTRNPVGDSRLFRPKISQRFQTLKTQRAAAWESDGRRRDTRRPTTLPLPPVLRFPLETGE